MFVRIIYNSIPLPANKTRVCITKINLFMPFKEVIIVYSENHTKLINKYTRVCKMEILWLRRQCVKLSVNQLIWKIALVTNSVHNLKLNHHIHSTLAYKSYSWFAGSNSAAVDGFLRAIKIRSTLSFGGEVKSSDPCREILWHDKNPFEVWTKILSKAKLIISFAQFLLVCY
jgi:hypothetical protein